jgi:hypothetical protein
MFLSQSDCIAYGKLKATLRKLSKNDIRITSNELIKQYLVPEQIYQPAPINQLQKQLDINHFTGSPLITDIISLLKGYEISLFLLLSLDALNQYPSKSITIESKLELLQFACDSLPICITIGNADPIVQGFPLIYASSRYLRTFGYEIDEVINRNTAR